MTGAVRKVRTAEDIDAVRALVWEFFDDLKARYTDMVDTIDAYIIEQDVAGELENFAEKFLPPNGDCFLAEYEGTPVGMVMLKPHGDGDGELNRMYIRGTARGQGLGRHLCNALLDEARALGMGTIWLDALYRHAEALPLYESLGFVYYSDPNAFGGDDERVIHMKLKL